MDQAFFLPRRQAGRRIPRVYADSTFFGSFGGVFFEEGDVDENDRDNQQHVRDRGITEKISESYSTHNLLLLSERNIAATNVTIPNGRLMSNSFTYSNGSTEIKPGLMRSTPNHPDDKFKNNDENNSETVLADNFVYHQPNIQDNSLSTDRAFPFVRQAYAADSDPTAASGQGCRIPSALIPAVRAASYVTKNYLWQMPNRTITARLSRFAPILFSGVIGPSTTENLKHEAIIRLP